MCPSTLSSAGLVCKVCLFFANVRGCQKSCPKKLSQWQKLEVLASFGLLLLLLLYINYCSPQQTTNYQTIPILSFWVTPQQWHSFETETTLDCFSLLLIPILNPPWIPCSSLKSFFRWQLHIPSRGKILSLHFCINSQEFPRVPAAEAFTRNNLQSPHPDGADITR